jgi:hypothetical protein
VWLLVLAEAMIGIAPDPSSNLPESESAEHQEDKA